MAPSAIVALCLLALASAAPQNLQSLQCATSCDMSRQANVGQIGKTYTYAYNVQSIINIAGVQDAKTQGQISGTVHVSRINPCEMAIKFISNDATAKVNKYPLILSLYERDQFGKVCAHHDDDSESINIKKGIASAIQFTLPSVEPIAKKIVAEKSVLGICPTAYSVQNNGNVITVNKESIHSECQDHAYSHSDIPSILSKSPMPVQVSKSVCQQVMSSTKVLQTVTCKDTKVVRPAYGTYKYIEASQESTLQFKSESTDMSYLNLIKGAKLLNKKWSYDHSMQAKNPALAGKLDSVLKNVCTMIQGQGHQDAAAHVTEAIELMKHIPEDAYVTVVNKIRAGDYCTEFSKLEALFMDAIAFIGEPGAVKVMAQEVSAGRVTGDRLVLYTAALHLLSKPNINHVAALTPIAAMGNPSATITLAAAAVVNKHCKLVNGCENTPVVKNILNLLVNKLASQCTPAFSNINSVAVLTTLKALGNIGFMAPEHAEKIAKCAKTEGVEINVRFAAAIALKGAPCMTPVKNNLLNAALDGGMNTEVRIGAYLAAIRCAEESDIQKIIAKINTDSNKQVYSFVMNHLRNIKVTNWPRKDHLQKFLKNINIPNTFGGNIFKYSKNIELAFNTPVLGLGAGVESNVVYGHDSYLPRLVNLGLNMNLLGSFINIGEVGARVEGLEPIIKEAFGPESYLHKTPLNKIVKDTSIFIKQNGASLYNKLENLIKQKESFDVNAIVQLVSKFLMANNIKLPKTDLYAKLMGQEFAFLSVAGPMQEVNIINVVEKITLAVVDALVAGKDLDIDTARATHLHIDYAIPTIQGIPLNIKLEGTAVVGFKALSKLESKAKAHDAIVKIIPSLSIAIDGHIGYGAVIKHGLKMKNAIYSTNGMALYANLKNGQDLEVKVELPEKMELINVKSEVYLMTRNNMMDEVKVYPNVINDLRITKQHCLNIAEPLTGLHVCYAMNIPNVISSKGLPLGLPVSFKVYLQKADAEMKGYRITAAFKNKVGMKVLKMVAGTYGSPTSTESSVKIEYTKEGNTYLTAVDIKSVLFASNVEATFANQANMATLQIVAEHKLHKFNSGLALAAACKFNIKHEQIANGKQYQITGFAGLTKALTDNHRFLNVQLSHAPNGDYNKANLLVKVETLVFPVTIGFELDVPTKAPWFIVIHKVELKVVAGNIIAVEGAIQRKGVGHYLNLVKVNYYGSNLMKIEATHTVTGQVFKNFNLITDAKATIVNWEIGTTFTFKHENSALITMWEFRNAGAKILNINLKHIMAPKLYTTTFELVLPTLPKTLKINNVVEVVQFLNCKLITDVHMDNTALVHIEGPVSWQFSKAVVKQNIDLKISGAFDGTIKFMHTALVSLEKTQFIVDMRHAATPLLLVDIMADITNAAETTAKAVIHLPIIVKSEYAAVISSGLIHTSMNIFVLPTTSVARRFKGYADFNLEEQKVKADFYWDAEKNADMKMALATNYRVDTSLRKILVQGDLTVTTLKYGFKLETLLASPWKWFHGTSGIEFAVTAPSNKMFITKALWTVEQAESIILKPVLVIQTLNGHKYEFSGLITAKRLPALLNFDINNKWTIIVPGMKKVLIANRFLHEDKNGACTITFKTGITGLNKPIGLEIFHEISANKYTALVKVENGATVSTVSSNIAFISGLKVFDITVEAILPWAPVGKLAMKATKTAEGTVTIFFTKNQMVLARLHYIMASLYTHTVSFECPSRTIEIFASINGNEMTLKVFPEKNHSSKVMEAIVYVTKRTGSTHIECIIAAPSLANELRIAAEFALANPAMQNQFNVDIQFPVAEFKILVNAVVEELQKIHGDFVKDGLLPDIIALLNKLLLVLRELPKYVNAFKMQVLEMVAKYWPIVRNWVMKMWKVYEADIIAIWNNVHVELLRHWNFLKIEVPIMVKEFMTILKKTELWKVLYKMVNEIINHFPFGYNILIDFYNKVILETVAELKELVNRIMTLPAFNVSKIIDLMMENNDFAAVFKKIMEIQIKNIEGVWNIMKTKVPAIIANLTKQLFNTELVTFIIGKLQVHFPNVVAIWVDMWNHVLLPTHMELAAVLMKIMDLHFTNVTEIIRLMMEYNDLVAALKKIVEIQITNVSEIIGLVMEDIVPIFHNLLRRLMKCQVVGMMKDHFPTVVAIWADMWNHHLVPTYKELAAVLMKINEILFTHVSKVIDLMMENNDFTAVLKKFMEFQIKNVSEILGLVMEDIVPIFHKFMRRLRNCQVVQMFITNVHHFICFNPTIEALHVAVVEVGNTIYMALRGDIVMIYKNLMANPRIKNLVDFIWNIINSKIIKLEPITLKTFTAAVHVFVTDVLGMTRAGNRFTTVVTLPCSVDTLNRIWISSTKYLVAVSADVVNTWVVVIENIPFAVNLFKNHVPVIAAFIAEQFSFIIRVIEIHIPQFINDLIPTIKNFIDFLMNTEIFKFLKAKVVELINMYPTEFNVMKKMAEKLIELTIQYTRLFYTKMMEIPVIKKIVDYIWNLINRKDIWQLMELEQIQRSMVFLLNWVSTSVISFSQSISSHGPSFIKVHVPSALSSLVASLVQQNAL